MGLRAVGDGDATHEVERGTGTRVVFDVETFEGDGEGERLFLSAVVSVRVGGLFVQPQVQGALLSGEPGDESSAQDNQQGEMQQPGGQTHRASAQQIDDGRQGQQQPEQDECGRAVDVAGDKGGTLDFFENGCRGEYTQHEGQQAKGESFEYLHCMERGFFIPRNADAQCAGISQHGVQEGRVC